MKIYELKNKIVEVWAAARIIVQKYGHRKKFAKHLVAFAIKQTENLTDEKLAKFVGTDKIGKIIGYKKVPNPSTFSKVRKRSNPEMFEQLLNWILEDRFRGKQMRLIAQDSVDISAYSKKDKDARKGVRTIPKKRQLRNKEGKMEWVEFFFGYKLHVIIDVETEAPISFTIEPGNRHDKVFFEKLFIRVKQYLTFRLDAKFLADSGYDSADIKEALRNNQLLPVIASNGRGHFESEIPKDKEYGRRWSIEHFFSRLKEVLGFAKNRFIGIKKVKMHAYSCILAYVIRYLM